MKISIEHFNDQFNVRLHTAEGKDPFIVIKGCRLKSSDRGEFISWPSVKNTDTGKWWNHVYAPEPFQAAVIAEVHKSAPPKLTHGQQKQAQRGSTGFDGMDDYIPFN